MYERDPKYGSLGIGWTPPIGGEKEIIITDPGPEGIIPRTPSILDDLKNMFGGVTQGNAFNAARAPGTPGPKNGPPKIQPPMNTAGFVLSPMMLGLMAVGAYLLFFKKRKNPGTRIYRTRPKAAWHMPKRAIRRYSSIGANDRGFTAIRKVYPSGKQWYTSEVDESSVERKYKKKYTSSARRRAAKRAANARRRKR